MTRDEIDAVIAAHGGNKKIAARFGISPSSVSNWRKEGCIPAKRLEVLQPGAVAAAQPNSTDPRARGYRKGVLDALEKLIDAGIVTAPGLLNALTASAPATPSKERLVAAVASYGGVLAFCEAFGFSVDSLFLWPAGTQAKRINAAVFACEARL